jgi:hypothetical protein
MRLLNETFNDDFNVGPFIDEFDAFEEFDIEIISRDYEKNFRLKNNTKDIDDKI